jgi:hypothetical protein
MKNKDFLSVYGTDVFPSTYNTKFSESKRNLGRGNIFVSSCQFIECKSDSNGGGIYVSATNDTKMLVEKSTFDNCQTTASGSGGAIHFGFSGNCVLSEVCGYECRASSNNQFDYIQCTESVSYKNYVNDSTIFHSVNENSGSAVTHYHGIVLFKGVNCSFNRCKQNAACVSGNTASTTKYRVTCTLSFCSFTNNNATQGKIIYLYINTGNKEIKSCNIVDNSQEDLATKGIIHIGGPCEIKDSCITGNIAKYTFYEGVSSSTITVSNCTLDADVESKKNYRVTIKNKATSSFIIPLVHLKTDKCAMKTSSKFWHTQGSSLLIHMKDIIRMMTLIFTISFLTSEQRCIKT